MVELESSAFQLPPPSLSLESLFFSVSHIAKLWDESYFNLKLAAATLALLCVVVLPTSLLASRH